MTALAAYDAQAMLVTSHTDSNVNNGAAVDGVIGAGEYDVYSYAGGGSGFGGPLGGGTLYFESDLTNLYIGASLGFGSLGSNVVTIYLDSRAGGFSSDSGMNDVSDDGRRVVSKLTRNVADTLPIQADFALQFGAGYTALFELTSGTHNFIATPLGQAASTREVSIPLTTLGLANGDAVTFFTTLISSTQFTSDEGIPATGFLSGNPGFGSGGPLAWTRYHEFVTAVPEVSPALALPLAAAAVSTLQTLTGRRRSDDE